MAVPRCIDNKHFTETIVATTATLSFIISIVAIAVLASQIKTAHSSLNLKAMGLSALAISGLSLIIIVIALTKLSRPSKKDHQKLQAGSGPAAKPRQAQDQRGTAGEQQPILASPPQPQIEARNNPLFADFKTNTIEPKFKQLRSFLTAISRSIPNKEKKKLNAKLVALQSAVEEKVNQDLTASNRDAWRQHVLDIVNIAPSALIFNVDMQKLKAIGGASFFAESYVRNQVIQQIKSMTLEFFQEGQYLAPFARTPIQDALYALAPELATFLIHYAKKSNRTKWHPIFQAEMTEPNAPFDPMAAMQRIEAAFRKLPSKK